jgi:alcohol dehydrogenase class IV
MAEAPTANWNYPTQIHLGAGRRSEITDVCLALNICRPLVVTDPGLAELPMIQDWLLSTRASGLELGLFSAVQGNPTGRNVEEGSEAFRAGAHDSVIALGGGSALDAGKAIAFAAQQSHSLWGCEDNDGDWFNAEASKIAPVIAIPTTAGTGSEVGRAALITHEQLQVKKIIWHPQMLPKTVILDPELTVALPAHITAATGMDALSHNLEAWCAPHYHPMAEGISLQGMKLVKDNLNTAVANGGDLYARSQMLVASSMGATAFQRGLGGMHALAHPLGAVFNAHHGLLNAILMPYVLLANERAIASQLAEAARYLDLPPSYTGFVDWVLGLRAQLQIPNRLSEIGIDGEQAERIGQMAVEDPSAGGNPIQFSADEYSAIFQQAVAGDL